MIAVTPGRCGVFTDVFYAKSTGEDAGGIALDVQSRMWLVDFGLQYLLLGSLG